MTSQAASVIPRQSVGTDACTDIHNRVLKNSDHDPDYVKVSGELALECLKSMPFESKRAVAFIEEIRKWMQFQSTIEILKKPPADYPMPATDLLGGLDDIQEHAAASKYTSHYEFEDAIHDVFASADDGHLNIELCTRSVFGFMNGPPLISISSNGTAIPEVYLQSDAKLKNASDDALVSHVVSINGADVDEYLTKITKGSGLQDWDSLYNFAFASEAISIGNKGVGGSYPGHFSSSSGWNGAYHAVHFANGTTKVYDTYVKVAEFPFKNGRDFYEKICIPAPPSSSATPSTTPSAVSSSAVSATALVAPSFYPTPFNKHKLNKMLGFFPEVGGLQDTAVLAIPTFELETEDQIVEFADIARDLLNNSTEKGKKNLIIDLSGNGGGTIITGQSLFKMIFPDKEIYSANRFRVSEATEVITEIMNKLSAEDVSGQDWDWRSKVKPDQTGFKSFDEFYGPYKTLGVNSSALISTNFTAASEEVPMSGYGEQKLDPAKAAFAPEDIILLTDGYCGSTCTIFAELMKQQGVRRIAFGGRPKNGPMQAIGGVKGSQVLKASAKTATLTALAVSLNNETFDSEFLEDYRKVIPPILSEMSYNVSEVSVNEYNQFGPKNDRLPLQFKYEAAECRRFYQYENYIYQETTWASALDAMFKGGECVPGSTNATGSLYAKKASTKQSLLAALLEYSSS
ncbi:unnamed protein product [Penicillium pancosmium]